MATHKPIIHVFSEINVGKYKSVKHYELIEVRNGSSLLTEQINISKDRNYAQSMPEYWLKVKIGTKWSRCITGLFKTCYNYVFKGDLQRKKHLIIIKFSNNAKTLIAYVFENYYTNDLSEVLTFIKDRY
ncbi:hypothetical protein [Aestuariivivens sediminicola]|uniref:hypothetical protein n=1 Tax=Aestuariivivens sediminicola TaxID=2913560 RepID=UPI001F5999CB|nr:hypothetical protein [Aestuariivivens sediminicola]